MYVVTFHHRSVTSASALTHICDQPPQQFAGGFIGRRVVNGGRPMKLNQARPAVIGPLGSRDPASCVCVCVCVCVSWLCCDTNSSSALITTNTHSHIVYLYPGLDVVNIITEQSNLCVHARLMWHMEPNVPVSRKN